MDMTMKTRRIFTTLVAMLAFVASVALFSACSEKLPSAEEVAKRIDAKETLSTADYTAMINYCGEYAKKAQPLFDIINAQPDASTPEAVKAAGEMADLYANYRYLDMFRSVLENTDESALGAKNVEKVNELSQFQAFPLPEGAGPDLNQPGVVGQIEQMPDSDTSGVISTGVGEVVNLEVKK